VFSIKIKDGPNKYETIEMYNNWFKGMKKIEEGLTKKKERGVEMVSL